jgi:hypothetical protein
VNDHSAGLVGDAARPRVLLAWLAMPPRRRVGAARF